MSDAVTLADAQRAVRFVVALVERDQQVSNLVAREVELSNSWRSFGFGCALVAVTSLVADEDKTPDGDGSLALWLHAAVEQLLGDGTVWWLDDDGECASCD